MPASQPPKPCPITALAQQLQPAAAPAAPAAAPQITIHVAHGATVHLVVGAAPPETPLRDA